MKAYIQNILNDTKSQVLVDQAIFSGCGFLITLLIVRVLSPLDFGIYSSVVLFNYFALNISNSVIIQPLQVYLAKTKSLLDYTSFTFHLQLFLILVLGILILGIFQIEIEILRNTSLNPCNIILIACSFLLHDFFRKLFLAKGEILNAIYIDGLTSLIQVASIGYIAFTSSVSLSSLILFMGFSYLSGLILGFLILQPVIGIKKHWHKYMKVHARQGKWLLMTAVLQWGASNFFVIASGVFLGATALGAFRLIQSVFGVLNLVLQTFENYALPCASRLFQTSKESSKIYLKEMSYKGALFIGVLLFLLFFLAEFIIVLIGGEAYSEYAFLVRGMSLLYFFIFLGYPTRIAIRMMELNHLFFVGYVLSFVFSLLSFQFLLREWNLLGAIIGLISNQIILFGFWQYILIKKQFNLWK